MTEAATKAARPAQSKATNTTAGEQRDLGALPADLTKQALEIPIGILQAVSKGLNGIFGSLSGSNTAQRD